MLGMHPESLDIVSYIKQTAAQCSSFPLTGIILIWANYHDEDGSLGEAFHREGIPLGVLIDAAGKITFYESGYEIPQLRAAIAKLGPQFSPTAATGTSSK